MAPPTLGPLSPRRISLGLCRLMSLRIFIFTLTESNAGSTAFLSSADTSQATKLPILGTLNQTRSNYVSLDIASDHEKVVVVLD